MPTIDSRTQVSLYKAIERYGHLSGDRLDTEATAAEIMRDFIVIPRDQLPEVVPHPRLPKTFTVGGGEHTTHSAHDAEYARERGIGYLAIAEHFDKHPPLDEAQVDALAKALMDARTQGDPSLSPAEFYHDFARRLVKAGVRAPQAGDHQ